MNDLYQEIRQRIITEAINKLTYRGHMDVTEQSMLCDNTQHMRAFEALLNNYIGSGNSMSEKVAKVLRDAIQSRLKELRDNSKNINTITT